MVSEIALQEIFEGKKILSIMIRQRTVIDLSRAWVNYKRRKLKHHFLKAHFYHKKSKSFTWLFFSKTIVEFSLSIVELCSAENVELNCPKSV